jgi:dipeptidyl aminopeptidase/acylaminoacyl peptidase
MIDLHFDGMVSILVQRGMDTAIEVWKGAKQLKTLLELQDAAISTANGSWHVRRLPNGIFSIAVIKSSGIDRQSEEIWITSEDTNGGFTFDKALTAHDKELEELNIKSAMLEWESDGIKVQGTVTYPSTYTPTSAHLPTVLLIHGGPYSRTTPDFKLDQFRLQLFLASQGYLVLSPNYRGSSGRGSVFARVSASQLVTASWSDCDSMIDHTVSLGLADSSRLGLAGHSSGGYLAALGASITKAKYKACITWSGASDLVSLTGTSQTPDFQLSMSGLAPWLAEPEELLQNVGGRMVHPSPMGNLEDLETPFLILHGEEDSQVPVSQAVVLWRGLKRLLRFPNRHVMVI